MSCLVQATYEIANFWQERGAFVLKKQAGAF